MQCGSSRTARSASTRPAPRRSAVGVWPKGTADQYIFDSGIYVAGIIEAGDKSVNGAGDTAGALLLRHRRRRQRRGGPADLRIFNASDPVDGSGPGLTRRAVRVCELGRDPGGRPLRPRCSRARSPRRRATSGSCRWEGNPARARAAGRHPLGVAVETRGAGLELPHRQPGHHLLPLHLLQHHAAPARPTTPPCGRPSRTDPARARRRTSRRSTGGVRYRHLPAGGYTIRPTCSRLSSRTWTWRPRGRELRRVSTCRSTWAITYEQIFASRRPGHRLAFDPAIFGAAPFFTGPGLRGRQVPAKPDPDPDGDRGRHLLAGLTTTAARSRTRTTTTSSTATSPTT